VIIVCGVRTQVNNAEWQLGDALCDTWVAFDVMCCTASILNLVAISIDRCVRRTTHVTALIDVLPALWSHPSLLPM